MAHKIRQLLDTGHYFFWCPGCQTNHRIDSPRWTFNGDYEKPTFSPSLVTDPNGPNHCHLFVRDGKLEFLADSKHALAGKTVDMEDVTES